jgi:hypothetical protein
MVVLPSPDDSVVRAAFNLTLCGRYVVRSGFAALLIPFLFSAYFIQELVQRARCIKLNGPLLVCFQIFRVVERITFESSLVPPGVSDIAMAIIDSPGTVPDTLVHPPLSDLQSDHLGKLKRIIQRSGLSWALIYTSERTKALPINLLQHVDHVAWFGGITIHAHFSLPREIGWIPLRPLHLGRR